MSKRKAEKQLTPDDYDNDHGDENMSSNGTFQRAPDEVLAGRKYVKARRRLGGGSETPEMIEPKEYTEEETKLDESWPTFKTHTETTEKKEEGVAGAPSTQFKFGVPSHTDFNINFNKIPPNESSDTSKVSFGFPTSDVKEEKEEKKDTEEKKNEETVKKDETIVPGMALFTLKKN